MIFGTFQNVFFSSAQSTKVWLGSNCWLWLRELRGFWGFLEVLKFQRERNLRIHRVSIWSFFKCFFRFFSGLWKVPCVVFIGALVERFLYILIFHDFTWFKFLSQAGFWGSWGSFRRSPNQMLKFWRRKGSLLDLDLLKKPKNTILVETFPKSPFQKGGFDSVFSQRGTFLLKSSTKSLETIQSNGKTIEGHQKAYKSPHKPTKPWKKTTQNLPWSPRSPLHGRIAGRWLAAQLSHPGKSLRAMLMSLWSVHLIL